MAIKVKFTGDRKICALWIGLDSDDDDDDDALLLCHCAEVRMLHFYDAYQNNV